MIVIMTALSIAIIVEVIIPVVFLYIIAVEMARSMPAVDPVPRARIVKR